MPILSSLPNLKRNFAARYSPWLLIGLALILALAISVFAVRNAQRERAYMSKNLMDRADALIWAMEAGTRAGMSMRKNSGQHAQALIEETAKQPGVVYIAVADESGRLIASSDNTTIGQELYPPAQVQALRVGEKSQWRSVTQSQGQKVFEVYKDFLPLPGFRHHMWHAPRGKSCSSCASGGQMGASGAEAAQGSGGLLIFIGLDMHPFEEALAEDVRTTVVTGLSVGLLALGGFVCLFWAQNYRLSRRLLQDTRAFASEVVTSMPEGLITTDEQGRITLMNTAAADLFNTEAGQLEGTKLDDLAGIPWAAMLQRIHAGKPVDEEEYTLVTAQKEPVPVSVTGSEIINEENVHLGFLFLVEDIRERKRLQEQLRRSERLSTLGHMGARVAHEIRNPLSSVKGFARYFYDKMPAGGGKEIASTMMDEVDRLNRVVTELLDFARPSPVTMQEGNINEVISRALRLTEDDARTKGIRIAFEATPDVPSLFMDFERLTQVFLNLFINAMQAMEQGGTLGVTTTRVGNSKLMVSVTDTGSGMSEEVLHNVFSPYYTTKATGTGLGLAIVLKILEEHTSEISVDSVAGQGTTFRVTFPLARGHEA